MPTNAKSGTPAALRRHPQFDDPPLLIGMRKPKKLFSPATTQREAAARIAWRTVVPVDQLEERTLALAERIAILPDDTSRC